MSLTRDLETQRCRVRRRLAHVALVLLCSASACSLFQPEPEAVSNVRAAENSENFEAVCIEETVGAWTELDRYTAEAAERAEGDWSRRDQCKFLRGREKRLVVLRELARYCELDQEQLDRLQRLSAANATEQHGCAIVVERWP